MSAAPPSTKPWSQEQLRALYRTMLLIRRFEERLLALSRRNLLAGSIHLCVGQEAVAVGAAHPLRPGDMTVATYRGHGHVLARGVDPYRAMAEVLGRRTGLCKGKGGSMHLTDMEHGVLPPNSIVGAGLPIATGVALAQRRADAGAVTLCAFGEGALNQGATHEAFNLAAIWDLPVVFLCENNLYAEMTPAYDMIRGNSFGARVAAYGIPTYNVDGMDVCAVAETVAEAVARARSGQPVYVEASTYRFLGHYQGDAGTGYRSAEEVEQWRTRDPLALLSARVQEKYPGAAFDVEAIGAEVEALLERCEEQALADPWPAAADLEEGLYVAMSRSNVPAAAAEAASPPATLTYAQALNRALAEEMERDDRVMVFGEDVGAYGGVFGVTRGLQDRFGRARVMDTPISETGFLGCAVGAAMSGLRPVAELMFVDFSLVALDQIVNQAAKLPYISGGQVRMPLVIRTQQGARPGVAAQHAQCLEAIFSHVPGLRVVAPATPRDAYGLLKAAIRCDDPVIFLEHKGLYAVSGPAPQTAEPLPLDRAAVVRGGRDVTVLTYSAMLPIVLETATRLAEEGIEAEVVDLRVLAPIDYETILNSLAHTNRLVIVHEAWQRGGLGAELAGSLQERGFDLLDAPIVRVGARDTPKPYSPGFDSVYLPSVERISAAIRAIAGPGQVTLGGGR